MTTLSLSKMSSFVFDLPEEYHNIIRYLALNGPANLSKISQFTSKSEKIPIKRWGVKKRILGTSRLKGLVPHEYIFEMNEDKKRWNKPEKTYYLKSKGVMATLSSVSLKKNYFFNKMIDYANGETIDKKYPKFILEYIISQITVFLSFHYIQGIQLTWLSDYYSYYTKFFRNLHEGLSLSAIDNILLEEFRTIIKNYVVLQTVYDYINGKNNSSEGVFPSLLYYKTPTKRIDKKNWHSPVFHAMAGGIQAVLENPSKDLPRIKRYEEHEFNSDKEHWHLLLPEVKKKLIGLGIRDDLVSDKSSDPYGFLVKS